MPHELTELRVDTVTRPAIRQVEELEADICVVGAGIAGLSAARAARLAGRRVILVDALPVIGGQCVNSLIGLYCGVYGNGPDFPQFTHGIFDPMFRDLERTGDIAYRLTGHKTVAYDEIAMGRWFETMVMELGIEPILSASIHTVDVEDGRIARVEFASRYGPVRVRAQGWVDATGDAALTWEAGLPCRLPQRPIWGSQQFRLEHLHEAGRPSDAEMSARVREKADDYGLVRLDGLAFFFPERGSAIINMTHVEAPLDAVGAARAQMEGRDQADRVTHFLRTEFPDAFGDARVRLYGFSGRRQTRWVDSLHALSTEEVRAGTPFDDAVARTAWPIELHDRVEGYVWEVFDSDHVHYVPLRSLIPQGSRNLVAAGRCVDGDAAALSSVRVMGPCSAMGEGAAHTLDLTLGGDVTDVDHGSLRDRIRPNVEG